MLEYLGLFMLEYLELLMLGVILLAVIILVTKIAAFILFHIIIKPLLTLYWDYRDKQL